MANTENINKLINILNENQDMFPYATFSNKDGKLTYSGWNNDAFINKNKGLIRKTPLSFNLKNDNDLFALFAFTCAWSRTNSFDDALYFIAYMRESRSDKPLEWKDRVDVLGRNYTRKMGAGNMLDVFEDIREDKERKITFRSELFMGTNQLARYWKEIKNSLQFSEKYDDYSIFIREIRDIDGLGGFGKTGRLKVKIPFILRELRAQGRYKKIPGEWCCMPDTTVSKLCADPFFDISLSTRGKFVVDEKDVDADISKVLKQSEMIYKVFGDLYDLPLYSYEKLKDKIICEN